MKRTTIMVDEELLFELQQVAQEQKKSTASVIREALTLYVAEQRRLNPPENPLLTLVGLGSSDEPTDVADGRDEEMLRQGIDATYGWSVVNGGAG